MMLLKKASFLFLILFAVSLILFGLMELSVMDLIRLVGVSLGLTILYVLIYPYLRGVRKGDTVVVVANSLVPSVLGRMGKIISPVKGLHKKVIVKLDDGSEIVGILETYEELLSPPRVRLIYEERKE
jgi:hypothetical protein